MTGTDLGLREVRRTNALLTVLAILAGGLLLIALRGVILPLTAALFFSYLGMPVMRLGKRCSVPVPISVVVVILLFSIAIASVGFVFYTSGAQFTERLPQYQERLIGLRNQLLHIPQLKEYLTRVETQPGTKTAGGEEGTSGEAPTAPPSALKEEQQRIDWRKLLLSGGAWDFAGSILGGAGTIGLILVFLVFILLDRGRESLDRRIIQAFSAPGTDSARPILMEIHREIERYIVTKTATSLLTGVSVAGALALIDLPFALLFGIIAFCMNFVPNVGAIIASIPPLLVAAVHFDSSLGVVETGAALLFIQGGIGLFEPVIVGRRLHLNPMTVLVWLIVWGWMWGIWGMVLAVPLAAGTRIILERTRTLHAVGTLMSDDN